MRSGSYLFFPRWPPQNSTAVLLETLSSFFKIVTTLIIWSSFFAVAFDMMGELTISLSSCNFGMLFIVAAKRYLNVVYAFCFVPPNISSAAECSCWVHHFAVDLAGATASLLLVLAICIRFLLILLTPTGLIVLFGRSIVASSWRNPICKVLITA